MSDDKQKQAEQERIENERIKAKKKKDNGIIQQAVNAPATAANTVKNIASSVGSVAKTAADTAKMAVETVSDLSAEAAAIPGRVIGAMAGSVPRGAAEQMGKGVKPTLEIVGQTMGPVATTIAKNNSAAPAPAPTTSPQTPDATTTPFSINPFKKKNQPT